MTATIIDLATELLVDLSRIRLPELKLLFMVIGHPIVVGSAWVVVRKDVAATYLAPQGILVAAGRRTSTRDLLPN